MADEAPETIRLTADVVVIAPDENGVDHVLLIRRRWAPYAGRWALPGGHVDKGEDAADTAARELAEETGIAVAADELTELRAWHAPGRDPRGRYVTIAYRADLPRRATTKADDDAVEAVWRPVHEVLVEGLAFDHAGIVSTAVASRSSAWSYARSAD